MMNRTARRYLKSSKVKEAGYDREKVERLGDVADRQPYYDESDNPGNGWRCPEASLPDTTDEKEGRR